MSVPRQDVPRLWGRPTLTRFRRLYVVGIILAGVIALACGTTHQKWLDWVLLGESLGHMGILIVYAYQLKSPRDKSQAGDFIQTAGYLYTLLGFLVALLVLSRQELQGLNALFAPLAMKLSTSILGWFCGGLLSGAGSALGPVDATHHVNESLGSAANELRANLDRIIGTLREAEGKLGTMVPELGNTIQAHLASMLATSSEFAQRFKQIVELSKEFEAALRSSKAGAQSVHEVMEQTSTYLLHAELLLKRFKQVLQEIDSSK